VQIFVLLITHYKPPTVVTPTLDLLHVARHFVHVQVPDLYVYVIFKMV